MVVDGQGGQAAAETILDMRATGDYSKQSTKEYRRRWMAAYGHDFHMVCTCHLNSPSWRLMLRPTILLCLLVAF